MEDDFIQLDTGTRDHPINFWVVGGRRLCPAETAALEEAAGKMNAARRSGDEAAFWGAFAEVRARLSAYMEAFRALQHPPRR